MIPIVLNNRDLLQDLIPLIEFLRQLPDSLILLGDNASTYPPLLEWYASECPVEVHHLGGNFGPRGAISLLKTVAQPFDYFFTLDADLDFSGVPLDFLEQLQRGLEKYPVDGAGLSLRIDDVPEGYDVGWERKFWEKPIDDDWFEADCDTAGVLHRNGWPGGYSGIRSRHIQVRHLPWYHDDANRPPDYRWYLDHADHRGTYYTQREIARRRANEETAPA